jgi:pimeloyl-ACP methyl ester carboxylesterase
MELEVELVWDAVVPGLSRSFRVFTCDRRGHSQSERLPTQGSIEEVVADLAAFITTNSLAPAHVAGNSFGAAITLKCAAARPQLFASATAHEPPLIGMLGNHPALPVVRLLDSLVFLRHLIPSISRASS